MSLGKKVGGEEKNFLELVKFLAFNKKRLGRDKSEMLGISKAARRKGGYFFFFSCIIASTVMGLGCERIHYGLSCCLSFQSFEKSLRAELAVLA